MNLLRCIYESIYISLTKRQIRNLKAHCMAFSTTSIRQAAQTARGIDTTLAKNPCYYIQCRVSNLYWRPFHPPLQIKVLQDWERLGLSKQTTVNLSTPGVCVLPFLCTSFDHLARQRLKFVFKIRVEILQVQSAFVPEFYVQSYELKFAVQACIFIIKEIYVKFHVSLRIPYVK